MDSWRRNNLGEYYARNQDLSDSLTVAQRSLRMLSKFGVDLSDQEYAAILYHDGLYVKENDIEAHKNTKDPLVRMIHFCDSWSTFIKKV
jgi:hypothetical protein